MTEDIGEEFSTLEEAELHAATVANELARKSQRVTVSVLDENGTLVAKAMGTWPSAKIPVSLVSAARMIWTSVLFEAAIAAPRRGILHN